MNCSKTCWLSMKADIPNPKTSDGFGSNAAVGHLRREDGNQPRAAIRAYRPSEPPKYLTLIA
jgi:hypothetical protein